MVGVTGYLLTDNAEWEGRRLTKMAKDNQPQNMHTAECTNFNGSDMSQNDEQTTSPTVRKSDN